MRQNGSSPPAGEVLRLATAFPRFQAGISPKSAQTLRTPRECCFSATARDDKTPRPPGSHGRFPKRVATGTLTIRKENPRCIGGLHSPSLRSARLWPSSCSRPDARRSGCRRSIPRASVSSCPATRTRRWSPRLRYPVSRKPPMRALRLHHPAGWSRRRRSSRPQASPAWVWMGAVRPCPVAVSPSPRAARLSPRAARHSRAAVHRFPAAALRNLRRPRRLSSRHRLRRLRAGSCWLPSD